MITESNLEYHSLQQVGCLAITWITEHLVARFCLCFGRVYITVFWSVLSVWGLKCGGLVMIWDLWDQQVLYVYISVCVCVCITWEYAIVCFVHWVQHGGSVFICVCMWVCACCILPILSDTWPNCLRLSVELLAKNASSGADNVSPSRFKAVSTSTFCCTASSEGNFPILASLSIWKQQFP